MSCRRCADRQTSEGEAEGRNGEAGLEGQFPKTLPLEEQGRFALGYYHQRDVFRRKKDVPVEIDAAEAAADTSPEEE